MGFPSCLVSIDRSPLSLLEHEQKHKQLLVWANLREIYCALAGRSSLLFWASLKEKGPPSGGPQDMMSKMGPTRDMCLAANAVA